jgi:enediyne biosynthesis protein E8
VQDRAEEAQVAPDAQDDDQFRTLTLEAYADTFVPGAKRTQDDHAIAGAAAGPGAVEAGAVELLETPATGVTDGLTDLVQGLNRHAQAYADSHGLTAQDSLPTFVGLSFEHRTAVVRGLIAPDHPEKDIWILIALFCFMAFDTAAHMHTVDAIAAGHPGLTAMGYAKPDPDGLWRFPDFSYGRPLARLHPDTTPAGDPA